MNVWIVIFFAVQILHFLGTWKLYKKAGYKSTDAAIPVYNAYILTKIIKRPAWWVLLLFIPIVNNVMFVVLWVETCRAFGKNSSKDTLLAALTLGLYVAYLNYSDDSTYDENYVENRRQHEGGWLNALTFAVIAATIIRTFCFEAYTIPTSSMEKSMLIGDFLFVNKMSYGTRMPMTPTSFPLVHDTIPVVKTKSYITEPQLPYFRFPKIEAIENNDIVVFNWPADEPDIKPVDKKTNYIKRCVAIPGDELKIENGIVYINGKEQEWPERAEYQKMYVLNVKGTPIPQRVFHRLEIYDAHGQQTGNDTYQYIIPGATAADIEQLTRIEGVTASQFIRPSDVADANIWPENKAWNADFFGPITIPQKGEVIELNLENLPQYEDLIRHYEHNELEVKGEQIYINGEMTQNYEVQMDYYFMMGDNRDNSLDSRYWGYVPEDHIVGKPVFIWMSMDSHKEGFFNKIRTERVFTSIHGDGPRKSYFLHFVVLVALGYGANFVIKRKRKNKKA